MKRRLATLAAVAMFALAFSATPALASSHFDSHADAWVVTRGSTDVTGLPVQCGSRSYTATSGTVDSVVRMKGSFDAGGIATDAGRGIETYTLHDVWVKTPTGKPHRASGSLRIEATWLAGADVAGSGPFTSFSFVEKVRITGTWDGRSLAMRQLKDGSLDVKDSGTCTDLLL